MSYSFQKNTSCSCIFNMLKNRLEHILSYCILEHYKEPYIGFMKITNIILINFLGFFAFPALSNISVKVSLNRRP